MVGVKRFPFFVGVVETHWGETGGTPVSMDKEIRVNMGNSFR
jgi:hypothetical protein